VHASTASRYRQWMACLYSDMNLYFYVVMSLEASSAMVGRPPGEGWRATPAGEELLEEL
jgi:hypothetical protein